MKPLVNATTICLTVLTLSACGLAGRSAPKATAAMPKIATALCGPDDRPEGGMQGQTPLPDMVSGRSQDPYFCGMRIVGHSDIANRGANWQLARVGDCAYMASLKTMFPAPNDSVTTREPAGVAVIDAKDPGNPQLVQILHSPGSIDSVETLSAMDAGTRKVLVAGAYSGGGIFTPYPSTGVGPVENYIGPALDIFDISEDCTQPKLRTTYFWPSNVHDVTLNWSATRVYGTIFSGGIAVLDITDMADPQLQSFPLIYPDGSTTTCHTVTLNKEETRIYCAGTRSESAGAGPGPSIWDISDVSAGKPNPQIRFVGEADVGGQGNHHAVPATIDGKPHIVAANELAIGDCTGAAYPRIFDISDETNPTLVGEFRMEVLEHCDEPQIRIENGLGNYASHYNNVDNYFDDTRVGLFGMVGGGLRVVDLRDPANPREVAYYKPGANPDTTLQPLGVHAAAYVYFNPNVTDACGGRAWLNEKTGHIWFSCQSNGLYIAELSAEVRAYLEAPQRAGQ